MRHCPTPTSHTTSSVTLSSSSTNVRNDLDLQQLDEPYDDLTISDHVRVVVRCRPLNASKEAHAASILQVDDQNNSLEVSSPTFGTKSYTFNCVADETKDQAYVFRKAGKPIVDSALAGFNGAIIAYGQTGSGKTFTMQGTSLTSGINKKQDGRGNGVIQHLCEMIFKQVPEIEASEKGTKFTINASYLEIYNETLMDLLVDAAPFKSPRSPAQGNAGKLTIREDTNGNISVAGLSQFEVKSPKQCYDLLIEGAERRTVGATKMNFESSRSHGVFTLSLAKQDLTKGVIRTSRIHLVDLAGSERQKGTGATGLRLREAGGINKSLSALGTVINALSVPENVQSSPAHRIRKPMFQPRMPSCRDSKLTFLLKDALGGNAKLCLIATISPAIASIEETVSTLEFAKRCASVRNKAVVNERLTEDVAVLQQEVRRLQELLKASQKNMAQSKMGSSDLYRMSSSENVAMMRSLQKRVSRTTRPMAGTQMENWEDTSSPVSSIEKPNFERGNVDIKDNQNGEAKQASDVKAMKKKWGQMIETNRRLWTLLMQREEELTLIRENELKDAPGAISARMRQELALLRVRIDHNPELLILRHRLEAYENEPSTVGGDGQSSLTSPKNGDRQSPSSLDSTLDKTRGTQTPPAFKTRVEEGESGHLQSISVRTSPTEEQKQPPTDSITVSDQDGKGRPPALSGIGGESGTEEVLSSAPGKVSAGSGNGKSPSLSSKTTEKGGEREAPSVSSSSKVGDSRPAPLLVKGEDGRPPCMPSTTSSNRQRHSKIGRTKDKEEEGPSQLKLTSARHVQNLSIMGSLSSRTMAQQSESGGTVRVRKTVSFANAIELSGSVSSSSSRKRTGHASSRESIMKNTVHKIHADVYAEAQDGMKPRDGLQLIRATTRRKEAKEEAKEKSDFTSKQPKERSSTKEYEGTELNYTSNTKTMESYKRSKRKIYAKVNNEVQDKAVYREQTKEMRDKEENEKRTPTSKSEKRQSKIGERTRKHRSKTKEGERTASPKTKTASILKNPTAVTAVMHELDGRESEEVAENGDPKRGDKLFTPNAAYISDESWIRP